MNQQDLFTDNLIRLMRDALAGPVLSRSQRTRLFARIRMGMQNRENKVPALQRLPEKKQLYLWPVEVFILHISQEPVEWEEAVSLTSIPKIGRPNLFGAFSQQVEASIDFQPQLQFPKRQAPDETQIPDTPGWLFPNQAEPPADIDFPLLVSQEVEDAIRSFEETSGQLVLL